MRYLIYETKDNRKIKKNRGIISFNKANIDFFTSKNSATIIISDIKNAASVGFPESGKGIIDVFYDFANGEGDIFYCNYNGEWHINDIKETSSYLCIESKEDDVNFARIDLSLCVTHIYTITKEDTQKYSINVDSVNVVSDIRFKSIENLNKAFDKIITSIENGHSIIDLKEFGY